VTASDPPNWQGSARKFAATALVVAIGLYLTVRLIEAVATVLVIIAAVGAFAYVLILVGRYRRSRW
jgi:hypothetical protein